MEAIYKRDSYCSENLYIVPQRKESAKFPDVFRVEDFWSKGIRKVRKIQVSSLLKKKKITHRINYKMLLDITISFDNIKIKIKHMPLFPTKTMTIFLILKDLGGLCYIVFANGIKWIINTC